MENIGFGPYHKVRLGLMQCVESGEVEVAPVQDIKRAGLWDQDVEDLYIGYFSVCDRDKRGNIPPQIEEGMHLDRAVFSLIMSPDKDRQAQVDDRRVQGVHAFAKLKSERLVRIQDLGSVHENFSKVCVNSPIAIFVGIGQRAL